MRMDGRTQLPGGGLKEHGGRGTPPGVCVIGLCLTGNFAWTLAIDPCVAAPVASEPSLPFAIRARSSSAAALHMSDEEKRKLAARDVDVMALRFDGGQIDGNFNGIDSFISYLR